MTYFFIGVNGNRKIEQNGKEIDLNLTVSAYAGDEEGGVDYELILNQALELAKNLNVDVTSVRSGNGAPPLQNGAGSNQNDADIELRPIQTIVYRKQKNKERDGTTTVKPAIALYPPWTAEGRFGKYALTTAFMDRPDQLEAFYAWMKKNGVEIKDVSELPLYQAQGAPMRTYGEPPEDYEVVLPNEGLVAVRKVVAKKEDGTDSIRYRFVAFR